MSDNGTVKYGDFALINNPYTSIAETSCTQFFVDGNTEILRIDKDGFVFKGERIADAGEAYKAFMETMRIIQGE